MKLTGCPPRFCRKLAVFDTWSALAVHIAMDNTVVMEDISKWQESRVGTGGTLGAAAEHTSLLGSQRPLLKVATVSPAQQLGALNRGPGTPHFLTERTRLRGRAWIPFQSWVT